MNKLSRAFYRGFQKEAEQDEAISGAAIGGVSGGLAGSLYGNYRHGKRLNEISEEAAAQASRRYQPIIGYLKAEQMLGDTPSGNLDDIVSFVKKEMRNNKKYVEDKKLSNMLGKAPRMAMYGLPAAIGTGAAGYIAGDNMPELL